MFRIKYLMLLSLLSGCASQPVKVNIPVPIACPKPHYPPRPHLPIYDLTDASKPDEVMKAYVGSVYLQGKYIDIVTR